jgi:hypothetical protein
MAKSMYASGAEIFFPLNLVADLRSLRGEQWQNLVARIMALPENDPDALAFGLMMIRLDSCLSCKTDSYRAMRGCSLCAQQTVRRFKGTDEDLIQMWQTAREDVLHWIETGEAPIL